MHAPTSQPFQRPAPHLDLLTLAEASARWNRRISPKCLWRWCREGILAGDRVLRLPHARVGGRYMTTIEWLAAFLADYPIKSGDFVAATLAGRTRRSPLRTRPRIRSRPGRHDARRALAAAACKEAGL